MVAVIRVIGEHSAHSMRAHEEFADEREPGIPRGPGAARTMRSPRSHAARKRSSHYRSATEISPRAGILAFHFNCVTIAARGRPVMGC